MEYPAPRGVEMDDREVEKVVVCDAQSESENVLRWICGAKLAVRMPRLRTHPIRVEADKPHSRSAQLAPAVVDVLSTYQYHPGHIQQHLHVDDQFDVWTQIN